MYLRAISAAALLCAAIAPSSPVIAATAPAAPAASGTCAGLASEYDGVEKSLALTEAEGIGDDSAPRQTNRDVENSNSLLRASIVLTLMQAHHCALPDHSPSMVTYLSQALSCVTDRLKGTSEPPSCNQATWQPISSGGTASRPK